ncbi:phosphatase PAP2 family protein [Halomonas sp. H10-9-1]|uniref:phosphatase PAP2 family protein n=1 Tax=Halomonas sp. H10-9-1 TaxID=2950871 RepID=UPI0032DFB754
MPPTTHALSSSRDAVPSTASRPLRRLALAWAGFLLLMLAIDRLGLDFRLADALYRLQGDGWTLKQHVLLETWLHRGGRNFSQWMGGGVVLLLLVSLVAQPLHHWRRPLLYLFLAVAGSTLAVSSVKHLVPMECPWDLARYGGDWSFVGLLTRRPAGMPDTACFPAGHASAGYAWIALYFCLRQVRPRLRWLGLAVGLGLGVLFGATQQLRGAHFLSHDLWTLMLCWTISAVLASRLLQTSTPDITVTPHVTENVPNA